MPEKIADLDPQCLGDAHQGSDRRSAGFIFDLGKQGFGKTAERGYILKGQTATLAQFADFMVLLSPLIL